MTETQADILTKLAGAFAAVRCAGALLHPEHTDDLPLSELDCIAARTHVVCGLELLEEAFAACGGTKEVLDVAVQAYSDAARVT